MLTEVMLAFGTLLAIINPISTALVFNMLAKSHQRTIATKAVLFAACVLIVFLFIGQFFLDFFGITIYAFRVAGGLYLSKIGFDMLKPELRRDPEDYEDAGDEIAFIPLAIPLISGPGSMTSVLVLSETIPYLAIIIAIVSVLAISWVTLVNAHYLQRVLGPVGTKVVEKLLGLIVLVISVQFVFNGITGYLDTI